ncbi:transglutaminase domain-containing protein [Spirosoma koreense]
MLPASFCQRLWVLIVLCFLSGTALLFAQKTTPTAPAITFGKITPDQFSVQQADSSAEAVVLYAYGSVNFEENAGDLWMNFTHHVRTKINKKSAYERSVIELPIWRGSAGQHEYITEFDGYTYNNVKGDVTIDRLAKSGHFTEKVSDNYSLEKYTLPNVREGAIIEYKYTLRTPFSVNYNPRTWRFQQNIPVKWSEYNIIIPDYFYYKIMQSGYLQMAINEHKATTYDLYSGQNGASATAYRLAMKDIPAFRDEAYITTDEDYMAKIEFELASYQSPGRKPQDFSVTWPGLQKTLLEHSDFGGQIKRTGFLRETAQLLNSQQADTMSRVTAAYEYIRQSIKWNNENGLISSDGIKKVFDNKKGNAADINLMLVALLREMELDANPVILSTRAHGQISEEYPLLKKFNYVVAHVMVGGKDLLLDATDPYLPLGMLPVHCLNGNGRLIHATKSRFISLAPTERETVVYTCAFTIGADGDISGTLQLSHGGYSALSDRKSFVVDGKTKYLDGIRKKRPVWQIEQADFSGVDLKSKAFNTDYTITIPEACGRAGDRLYLRPMLTEGHGVNPFKEAERLYPVDFGMQKEEVFTATYALPAGYQVEEMPKPVSMSLPENGGRFVYQVSQLADNKIQVVSRVFLRRPVYSAGEYGPLRELFSRIVAKHAEQIVLKRGETAKK